MAKAIIHASLNETKTTIESNSPGNIFFVLKKAHLDASAIRCLRRTYSKSTTLYKSSASKFCRFKMVPVNGCGEEETPVIVVVILILKMIIKSLGRKFSGGRGS